MAREGVEHRAQRQVRNAANVRQNRCTCGLRTCRELAVRTTRRVSWNWRQAGFQSSPTKSIRSRACLLQVIHEIFVTERSASRRARRAASGRGSVDDRRIAARCGSSRWPTGFSRIRFASTRGRRRANRACTRSRVRRARAWRSARETGCYRASCRRCGSAVEGARVSSLSRYTLAAVFADLSVQYRQGLERVGRGLGEEVGEGQKEPFAGLAVRLRRGPGDARRGFARPGSCRCAEARQRRRAADRSRPSRAARAMTSGVNVAMVRSTKRE